MRWGISIALVLLAAPVDTDCPPEKDAAQEVAELVAELPRHDPIPMDACARKLTGADLGEMTNWVGTQGCKTQHPCAMRAVFDQVAGARKIDPAFYYALKWRESRWRHWEDDLMTQVKVSRTRDYGVSQINKKSFDANHADTYDWQQVVEDPLYNAGVGGDLLEYCYDYADDNLRDHFITRKVLSALREETDQAIIDEIKRILWQDRRAFREAAPKLPPPYSDIAQLAIRNQTSLAYALRQPPENWQMHIDTAPPGDRYDTQMVNEAAYACYNGGPSKWRRPWYKVSRYKAHVELFRIDLNMFSNLDQLVWDDDFVDTLTGATDQDLKKLLLGLRDCTESSS